MNDVRSEETWRSKSGHSVPGTKVSRLELTEMGFQECELLILDEITLPGGHIGVNWNTKGEIPDAPGIYAFTVEDGSELRVTYVGMTSHLWMVTKGHLPHSGGARGGQRYGRPKHAGGTRKRINVEAAAQIRAGRTVKHWVMIFHPKEALSKIESELIQRWKLRQTGWNRG